MSADIYETRRLLQEAADYESALQSAKEAFRSELTSAPDPNPFLWRFRKHIADIIGEQAEQKMVRRTRSELSDFWRELHGQ